MTGCLGGCYFGDGLGLTLVKLVVRTSHCFWCPRVSLQKERELPKSLILGQCWSLFILFGDGPIRDTQVMALAHCPLGNIFL